MCTSGDESLYFPRIITMLAKTRRERGSPEHLHQVAISELISGYPRAVKSSGQLGQKTSYEEHTQVTTLN